MNEMIGFHGYLRSLWKVVADKRIRQVWLKIVLQKPVLLFPLSFSWLECEITSGAQIKARWKGKAEIPQPVLLMRDDEEFLGVSLIFRDKSARAGVSGLSVLFDEKRRILEASCGTVHFTRSHLRK
ncbi:hypothetical protein [Prosthecobacter sp.]|uniref:hypothetical protein n=1 Tax=Prosthecobacter sp. TaxID=1965333 RepID=UPI003784A685